MCVAESPQGLAKRGVQRNFSPTVILLWHLLRLLTVTLSFHTQKTLLGRDFSCSTGEKMCLERSWSYSSLGPR